MSKDGGPAFPCEMPGIPRGKAGPTRLIYSGMTLRDHFAAKAMQASIIRGATNGPIVADSSYRFADAMLAERAK